MQIGIPYESLISGIALVLLPARISIMRAGELHFSNYSPGLPLVPATLKPLPKLRSIGLNSESQMWYV